MDLGGQQRQLQSSVGPINYQDAQGDWHAIDNTLVPSTRPGYWRMNGANDHEIHFKEDISASQAILVERNGVTAALTLIRIAYYDSALDQQSTIAPFGSALGTATARLARWDNVIGTADFFAWARGDGLKTGFRVKSLSGLPDPTTVGFDPATTYFVIVLRLDLVAGVGSVVDEGGEVSGSRDVGTV